MIDYDNDNDNDNDNDENQASPPCSIGIIET